MGDATLIHSGSFSFVSLSLPFSLSSCTSIRTNGHATNRTFASAGVKQKTDQGAKQLGRRPDTRMRSASCC